MLIYGLNPVLEALRAGRVTQVRVVATARDRMRDLRQVAESAGVPIRVVEAAEPYLVR